MKKHPKPNQETDLGHPRGLKTAGDVDNEKEIEEIYTLLTENYVEDDDAVAQKSILPSTFT